MGFIQNAAAAVKRIFPTTRTDGLFNMQRRSNGVWTTPDGGGWFGDNVGFWNLPREKTFQYWFQFFQGTKSKVNVTPYKAMTVAAFTRAIVLKAGAIASLKVKIYKEDNNGDLEEQRNHPLRKLLTLSPSPLYNKYAYNLARNIMIDLFGECYVRIFRDPRTMQPVRLGIIAPGKCEAFFDDETGDLFYKLAGENIEIESYDILHFKDMTVNGMAGINPIGLFKEIFGNAISTSNYVGEFFGNSGIVSGVYTHPGQLKGDAQKNIKESIKEKHTGEGNRFNVMVLEEGMKFQQVGSNPSDAALNDVEKSILAKISNITGVPIHLLASSDTMTFNSIEAKQHDFVKYTLVPRTEMIENEERLKLFRENQVNDHFIEYDLNHLMRGDMRAQAEYFTKLRSAGVLNGNEIRKQIGFNYVDDENLNLYQNPYTTTSKNSKTKTEGDEK